MIDDKITELPKSRDLGKTRVLEIAYNYGACQHPRFKVDEQLSTVECANCHAHLNPMEVLLRLAHEETRWHQLHERYQDEMRRLSTRQKTKCRKCGEMTEISNR